jgi:hypothetical protein
VDVEYVSVGLYQKEQIIILRPELGFVTFVAKLQKAKTRKDKDYFVLRTTVPKSIAEKISAEPGDYLFFKAKKAKWYHMLDWKKMQTTWQMLPNNIKSQAILEGVSVPGESDQRFMQQEPERELGSTSPALPMVSELQTGTCNP